MSLHGLLSVTIGVPNVEETSAYYTEFGLAPEATLQFAYFGPVNRFTGASSGIVTLILGIVTLILIHVLHAKSVSAMQYRRCRRACSEATGPRSLVFS